MEDSIIKQIKKLRSIEPDKRFTEQSRLLIIGSRKRTSIWEIIMRNVELGASVGLAGILIVTIFGGFSAWKFLSPFKLSNLDTTDLRAEADAIEAQIELTNLSYEEIPTASQSASTSTRKIQPKAAENPDPTPATTQTTEPAQTDEILSIDKALEKLAE